MPADRMTAESLNSLVMVSSASCCTPATRSTVAPLSNGSTFIEQAEDEPGDAADELLEARDLDRSDSSPPLLMPA